MASSNATRSAVTAPIAAIFRVNDDLIAKALEGLNAAELAQRLTDKNNPMLWIAGHVVETRVLVLRILGEQIDTPWGELFGRGATLQEGGRYPSVQEIKHVMQQINHKLYERLQALDDEHLAEPAKGTESGQTLADQIALFSMHDSYHVGQMAYIRKALGYPQIVG